MKNWKTTISGLLSLLFLAAWFFSFIDANTLMAGIAVAQGVGFMNSADAGKLQDTFKSNPNNNSTVSKFKGFILILGVSAGALSISSCTKGSFNAFFKQLEQEIPLQKVSYQMAVPKDTLLNWHSPYKIFVNQTQFRSDSIYHSEKFNFEGLGDFLWVEYQNWKAKRKTVKDTLTPKPSPLPINIRCFQHDKRCRLPRDGLTDNLLQITGDK